MKKNKPGQGRKNPYGEPTKQVQSKVPESKVEEFKQIVHKQLKKWHMKKLLLIIAVAALTVSCSTTKPVIQGDTLKDGTSIYQIQRSPSGRSYIIKDGHRVNLYRTKETVKL